MRWDRSLVASASVLLALAGMVAWGVHLRLADPLSSPMVSAEDPYTHVVFTKEALARGYFDDSDTLGTRLYPPGIHAFTGAFAPLAGVSLVDMARFGPVVLGAIAIIGAFALGRRLGGNAVGLACALATATMPEHVFRTNLYAPTAFDLALLPAWLLAFDVALRPRQGADRPWRSREALGGAALFVGLSIPLAFLHPWAVPLFAIPCAGYAALRIARGEPAAALRRTIWAAALVIPVSAFAMATRWADSDTGFADFFLKLGPLAWIARIDLPVSILFVVLTAVLVALAVPAVLLVAGLARIRPLPPAWARIALGAAVGIALGIAANSISAATRSDTVSFDNMFGDAVAFLALVGVVAALVRPSPAGEMGLAISVMLFPLTTFNLFDSEFWPQRTVAYLAVGVALLVGAVVDAGGELARRFAARRPNARWAAPTAAVAALLLVSGSVVAAPGNTYDWYRLYTDEEYEAFQRLVDRLNAEPNSRVILYSWQPALILKALGDPEQMKYRPDAFKDEAKRDKILSETSKTQYLLVERYVLKAEAKGAADTSFTAGWELVDKTSDGRYRLYEVPS